MKKNTLKAILASGALALTISITAHGQFISQGEKTADFYKEPQKVRCTCYIDRGTTASGQQTRPGIIAGKKEWIGKCAALYKIDPETGKLGDFLGYYEFLDTGAGMDSDGDGQGDTIITGNSVDVWQPSMADARAWIRENGDYIYMQIIDGKG
jgi:3D (Asp-Asp-Asp) domain-containing protein